MPKKTKAGGGKLRQTKSENSSEEAEPTLEGGGGGSVLVVATGMPDEIRRHNISDEELEMLREWRTDQLTQVWFAGIGALAGSFVSAVRAVYQAFWVDEKNMKPIGVVEICEIGVAVAAVTTLVVCYVIRKPRQQSLNEKISEIRSRSKVDKHIYVSGRGSGSET